MITDMSLFDLTTDTPTTLQQLLLDITLHLKKTAYLTDGKNGAEFVYIAQTNGLCLLLALHLAFSQR